MKRKNEGRRNICSFFEKKKKNLLEEKCYEDEENSLAKVHAKQENQISSVSVYTERGGRGEGEHDRKEVGGA